MTKPFQHCTVLPHSKLAQTDEHILSVVGEIHMRRMDLLRRMTAVRLGDGGLVVFSANALGEDEMSARVVRTPKGTTLVLNDVVGNIRDAAGFGGWLLHVRGGFAGKDAQIPTVVKIAVIEGTQALRAQLLQWAEIDTLVRLIVSHGSPIEVNPRQVLRELAASLT